MTEETFKVSGAPPVEPGVSPAYSAQKEGVVSPGRQKFSANTKLADIQEDYAFFHPALLYTQVPLDRGHDPFADFCALKNNSSLQPAAFVVGERFVLGFPPEHSDWSRTLFALEKDIVREYISFIASAAFTDRKNREVWFINPQEFEIKDPSCSAPAWEKKKIKVIFLGLETNKRTWYFEAMPSSTGVRQVRLIHTMRPDKISDEIRNASRAILENDIRI